MHFGLYLNLFQRGFYETSAFFLKLIVFEFDQFWHDNHQYLFVFCVLLFRYRQIVIPSLKGTPHLFMFFSNVFFSWSDKFYQQKGCLSYSWSTIIWEIYGTCNLSGTVATGRDCNGSMPTTYAARIIMNFGDLILLWIIVASILSFFELKPSNHLDSHLCGLCLHRIFFFFMHDLAHYMLH